MRKKITAAVIAAVLLTAALTACTGGKASTASADNDTVQSEVTQSSTDIENDCCKNKDSSGEEIPDCCKDTETSNTAESEVPDCCAGE